jgi:hypothetical protein
MLNLYHRFNVRPIVGYFSLSWLLNRYSILELSNIGTCAVESFCSKERERERTGNPSMQYNQRIPES